MARGLEAVYGEKVDAEFLSREGVSDSSTFMDDDGAGALKLLDDCVGAVACGFDCAIVVSIIWTN